MVGMTHYLTTMVSPIGELTLVATDEALVAIRFPGEDDARARVPEPLSTTGHPILRAAKSQLDEYFAGRRRAFDLPLAPAGTPFQQAVWRALLAIPFGETRSYADIARAIGQPSATRAVGAANGRNPLPIVLPCHRVVRSDGTYGQYRGGPEAKHALLTMEAA